MSRITKPYALTYLYNGSGTGYNLLDFTNSLYKPKGFEIFNNSSYDLIYYKTNVMNDVIPVFPQASSQLIFDVPFDAVIINGVSGEIHYWVTYR